MDDQYQQRTKVLHYLMHTVGVLVIVVLVALTITLHITRPKIAHNTHQLEQTSTLRARVLQILEERVTAEQNGLVTVYQNLEIIILTPGDFKNEVVIVDYNGQGPSENVVRFHQRSQALIMTSYDLDGGIHFLVADHIRLLPIATITGLFIVITLLIGRWQGARALIGLMLSGLVIAGFIVPQILALRDPMLVSLVGTALLLAITLYLIQGWNFAGHSALLGMLASLCLTGFLSWSWTRFALLTGLLLQ